jgi:hypothetical protein
MRLTKHYQRLISLFALTAMLLNVFAPTIAHAFAKVEGNKAAWMQICSVSGIQYVPLSLNLSSRNLGNINSSAFASDANYALDPNLSSTSSHEKNIMPMQHCAYCMSHTDHFAVFMQYDLRVFDRHINREFPPLYYQSHASLFAWVIKNPRAPPVSS